jgi:alpha-amylase
VHNLSDNFAQAGPFELPDEAAEVLFTDVNVAPLSKDSGAWRTTLPGRSTGIWRLR